MFFLKNFLIGMLLLIGVFNLCAPSDRQYGECIEVGLLLRQSFRRNDCQGVSDALDRNPKYKKSPCYPSMLRTAVFSGMVEMVLALLEGGVDIDDPGPSGEPLVVSLAIALDMKFASKVEYLPILLVLIDYGAILNLTVDQRSKVRSCLLPIFGQLCRPRTLEELMEVI